MVHSFFNLFFYVWGRTISVLGTTTTSIIYSFALVVLVFTVQILDRWWRSRNQGSTLMSALKTGLGRAILISVASYIVFGSLFFLYQTATFIYQDHKALLDRIRILHGDGQLSKNTNEKQPLIINVPPPTVIIKDKPEQRTLTVEQHNKLVDLLKIGKSTNIIIRHAQGSYESQVYSDYFASALKDAGWIIGEPSFIIEQRQGQGVKIVVHDLKESLPRAVMLKNSLKAIGVDADGIEIPVVPTGTFQLYIGVQ